VRILAIVQQGDLLKNSGDNNAALAKYRAAQTALKAFRKEHAEWNVKVVKYRDNAITAKIAEITGETIPAPGATPTPGTRLAGVVAKAPAATAGQTVKLLEAGAEPRTALRLHPKAGDKQTLQMTMKMAMDVKMGETQTPSTKLPPMLLTMEATVKDVSPDGDISYETAITEATVGDEPGVMPMVAEAMKKAMTGMKGIGGTGITTSRGINKKTEMKVPADIDPQMKQVMDQMKETFANISSPLPEEAVGAGAKWEVRQPIKSQGMTLNQTATYELVSLEGERLTTKATIAQSAANQKIQSAAMAGAKVDVTKLTGKSTADTTIDLSQLMPPASTMDMHTEMNMAMGAGAQKQNMSMTLDMNLRIESK
jgi:hypothetical protein